MNGVRNYTATQVRLAENDVRPVKVRRVPHLDNREDGRIIGYAFNVTRRDGRRNVDVMINAALAQTSNVYFGFPSTQEERAEEMALIEGTRQLVEDYLEHPLSRG